MLVGGKILQIWKEKTVTEEEEETPTRKFQLLNFFITPYRIKIMAPILGTPHRTHHDLELLFPSIVSP